MKIDNKILITGGTGLLGRALESTASKKLNIVSIHLKDYDGFSGKAKHIFCNILDKEKINDLFKSYKFDAVIHCAGTANVDYVEKNYAESLESNIAGTINIASACKKYSSHLVYVSTNAVFDGKTPPYSENSPLNPINKYGHMKVECEKVVFETLKNFTIARPILMYGWNYPTVRQNPVTWLLEKLKNNQTVNMVNDVYENPLYNIFCAEILWEIVNRKFFGVIHIAGAEIVNRYEFALKTADVFGLNPKLIKSVDSSFFPSIAPRPKNTSFKTEKMQKELGIKPLSLSEGLMLMKKEKKE